MKRPSKPTRALAMAAKCWECMSTYDDGVRDCNCPACPLYPWMPRRKVEPVLRWLEFNPRKKGWVRWEDCGRELTEEQKEESRQRLEKMRAKAALAKELKF